MNSFLEKLKSAITYLEIIINGCTILMNTSKVGYLLQISMKIRNWKYWTSQTIKRDVHILPMLQFCKYYFICQGQSTFIKDHLFKFARFSQWII